MNGICGSSQNVLALQIAVTSLVSSIFLMLMHWMPWNLALRKQLPRVTAYALGMLGIVGPLTALFCLWSCDPPAWRWAHLTALLMVTLAGGLSVICAYGLDYLLTRLARADELSEILDQRDERRSCKK